MKIRYLLLWILVVNSLFAKEFSSRYDVVVTLFEKVGYADLILKEDEKNYEIKLTATTTGMAATLLKNRVETFTSRGKIINGKYLPDIFIKTRESNKRSRTQTYYFDHARKEIKFIEEKTKLVSRSSFDPSTLNISYKDVKESSREEKMEDEYIKDDSLTTYLNTKTNCNPKTKEYPLFAIGANNDKNSVLLSYLDKNRATNLRSLEESDNLYNIHVEPFDKSDRIVDVLVALDSDGILKEAFMGEIFWVGKISLNRVYHKIIHN